MRRWFGGVALVAVTSAGIACGGCPGLSGTAEEVPVELDWPDASTLAPVQPIDPTAAPPAPVENRSQAGDAKAAAGGEATGDNKSAVDGASTSGP